MTGIALVAIGQTPRPDLLAAFVSAAPATTFRLFGALDAVPTPEIDTWVDPDGDYPLSVLLRDGRRVEIPRARFVAPLQATLAGLDPDDYDLAVVLCTASFPELQARTRLLLPGTVVPATVSSFADTRAMAVVTPAAGQIARARSKWHDAGVSADVVALAPTADPDARRAALTELSAQLVGSGAQLIVLDCFGFDAADAATVAGAGRPAVSAQDLTARIVGAFVAGAHPTTAPAPERTVTP